MFRVGIVAIILGLSLGGIARADTPYVPLGPYGSVQVAPTYAGVTGLTITSPQYSYGALQTLDYLGNVGATISSNGEVWVHPDYVGGNPRLVLSSPGYDGGPYNDTMIELIGSSPVFALSPGGEVESYNYYVNGDSPRISVRNRDDSLAGGIDGAGRYTTLAHNAPDPRDMTRGEARVWFDPNPTTGGLMVTMEYSDGTIRTKRL